MTTTPSKRQPPPLDLDKLRADVTAGNDRARQAQAALDAHAEEVAQQKAEREAAWDEAFLASYSRREDDQAVTDADAKLRAAIEADPVTQAIAAVQHAKLRRNHRAMTAASIAQRYRRPGASPASVPSADPPDVQNIRERVAEQLAHERLDAERQTEHQERTGA